MKPKSIYLTSGYRLGVAKNHKYTKEIINRFPDFMEETEEGYFYHIWYERKEELRECLENIDSKKGTHPAQDAYLELKQANKIVDLALEAGRADYPYMGVSEINYRYGHDRYDNVRAAQKKLEEAKKLKFARGKNYEWILVPKN